MLPATLLPMLVDDAPLNHPNWNPAPPVQGMVPAALLPMLWYELPLTYPALLADNFSVQITPLFNRIAVQLTKKEAIAAGTVIEGDVDILKNGVWHNGTELYQRYDSLEFYANCFNLRENTHYRLRITVRVRNTSTQEIVDEYVQDLETSTLSSETPQSGGGTLWYVDPVAGSSLNDGDSPSVPLKWLNDRDWQPGDTIVIMNGDFEAATTAQRRLLRAKGTADNWIRVIPYEPAGETARIQSPVTLNGPWTDESGMYPNTWSMSTGVGPFGGRLVGVVRDEDTGYEIQPVRYLDNPGDPTEPGLKQGNVDGHAVWHLKINGISASPVEHKLYIRTADGLEPPDDKFIGGYTFGMVMTACEYVVLDGVMFGLSQNIKTIDGVQVPGGYDGLTINTLSSAGNENSDWIILRNCDFQNCKVSVDDGSGDGVGLVLFDGVNVERKGPYETLYHRVDFSEGDPYDSDYGYAITKSSLWDRDGIGLGTKGLVAVRNSTIRGFHGVNPEDAASVERCKHLDVYWNTFERHLQAAVNLSMPYNVVKAVNAAVWANRMDHGAWAVAQSPINAGPVWVFANYGDGILHNPFKIGIQGPVENYTTANGNGFQVIANNSFAIAGFTTSEAVGVPDTHWYNLPPKSEDRTWMPQISAKVKHIKREQILDEFDDPTGMGLVTVEVFDEEDVAGDAKYGNDQFLEGLKVGHLVRVRYPKVKTPATQNDFALLEFEPLTALSRFAVTGVGHVDSMGEFQAGPNSAGNLVACQYIDTDRDDEVERTTTADTLNRGIWLDTTTGWTNFAYNTRVTRSMFLASTLPLACFHSNEHSEYLGTQQRQYRAEVMFHSVLHGEDRRYWYNPDLEQSFGATEDQDKAAERMTNDALLELGVVCNLDTTLRPAQLSPLSLNYVRPSLQQGDHIVSGANIRDDRRLFRVTLKDEWLMGIVDGDLERLYPKLVGPIQTAATEHVDFRTISGRVVRVPGQLFDFPAATESAFQDFGWWVMAEKAT